ncbi:MAG: hypothetical protein COB37_02505 [Kordiimonadales bacterium]|nr:MAG: hypothetical protein COB37_02505 [Kordiimonadales bacterium]
MKIQQIVQSASWLASALLLSAPVSANPLVIESLSTVVAPNFASPAQREIMLSKAEAEKIEALMGDEAYLLDAEIEGHEPSLREKALVSVWKKSHHPATLGKLAKLRFELAKQYGAKFQETDHVPTLAMAVQMANSAAQLSDGVEEWLYLGQLLEAFNLDAIIYSELVGIYGEALKVAPGDPRVHLALMKAEAGLENYDQAIHHFEATVRRFKKQQLDGNIALVAAQLYVAANRTFGGAEFLKPRITDNKGRVALALLLQASGETEEASALLYEVVATGDEDDEIFAANLLEKWQ